MPSNYTIAKTLKQVAYYREICGHSAGQYPGTAMEVQSIQGQRLDELEDPSYENLKRYLDEADKDVILTIQEILQGKEITSLKEDAIPLSILEITDIKGIGPKMARKAYDELGIRDLRGLELAVHDGTISKVKGFGQGMTQKILDHLLKVKKTK